MTSLLRDDIYASLREDILSCALPPGSDLREQNLAQRFAVSKSPVREALLRLAREQLVTVASRRGYRVSPISLGDARDLFRFRLALEPACATEAAAGATDAHLDALEAFREFDGSQDPQAFIAYNRRFHCATARCSANARMAATTCDLIEQMDRLVVVSINMVEARDPSEFVAEHNGIIDAMQARDGKRAARLLRAHVMAAEKRVMAGLERSAVRT